MSHTEVKAIVQCAKQGQKHGGVDQNFHEPMELAVRGCAYGYSHEDGEAAHQRDIAVVLLALIWMIHEA
ncbi:hypothetical protein GCM10011408_02600 [Dyella caseinilytica]|nr:hypothetical protein GCM10011408_02600 [Dyella caseinilytica]